MPFGTRIVTIQDIADELALSKMTVSAVLSGKAERLRISAATQARVREAAERLGYRPNEVARSLRRRSTNVVGFTVAHTDLEPGDPWLHEIVGGIQEGCRDTGFNLLLHCAAPGTSVEDAYYRLLDGRLDGLVYYGPVGSAMTDRIRERRLPAVAIVDQVPSLPSVVADDADGSRQIAAHLRARGRRRALYCPQVMQASSVHDRQSAFFDAAGRQGLAVEQWGKVDPGTEDAFVARWRALPEHERPDAVVAWDDATAYRIWSACRRAGVRVPDDLALVGFDGVPTQMEQILRLTTVRVPWPEVARIGVRHLTTLIAGQEPPPVTTLPVALVVGDTT